MNIHGYELNLTTDMLEAHKKLTGEGQPFPFRNYRDALEYQTDVQASYAKRQDQEACAAQLAEINKAHKQRVAAIRADEKERAETAKNSPRRRNRNFIPLGPTQGGHHG